MKDKQESRSLEFSVIIIKTEVCSKITSKGALVIRLGKARGDLS